MDSSRAGTLVRRKSPDERTSTHPRDPRNLLGDVLKYISSGVCLHGYVGESLPLTFPPERRWHNDPSSLSPSSWYRPYHCPLRPPVLLSFIPSAGTDKRRVLRERREGSSPDGSLLRPQRVAEALTALWRLPHHPHPYSAGGLRPKGLASPCLYRSLVFLYPLYPFNAPVLPCLRRLLARVSGLARSLTRPRFVLWAPRVERGPAGRRVSGRCMGVLRV